jgi:hypothetical protein
MFNNSKRDSLQWRVAWVGAECDNHGSLDFAANRRAAIETNRDWLVSFERTANENEQSDKQTLSRP